MCLLLIFALLLKTPLLSFLSNQFLFCCCCEGDRDGINVNKALVENNLAIIYTRFCDLSEFSLEEWAKPHCH